MGVDGWTGEVKAALITALVTVGLACVAGLRWLFGKASDKTFREHERGWQRAAELEEEVRLLRTALHKAAQHGNDGWTISEILSLAMPLSLEDRIRAAKQGREIAERSLEEGK